MALTQVSTDGIKNGTITGTDLATNIDLVDNQKLRIGTGNDLEIFHNGSLSLIDNTNGNLHIRNQASNGQIKIQPKSGEDGINVIQDGAVELYHNNVKKLETQSWGTSFTGNVSPSADNSYDLGATTARWNDLYVDNVRLTGNVFVTDGNKLKIGTSNDLEIYHDGSNSYFANSTGATLITGSGSGNIAIKPNSSEDSIVAVPNGNVQLYHNGSKKLETTSGGVNISGDLTFDTNFNQTGGKISLFTQSGFTQPPLVIRNSGNNTKATFIKFEGYTGAEVGSIKGHVNETDYNTQSDYRLKENVIDLVDSIARIKTLKPYRFNFKGNQDYTTDGFFAHEVSSALPQAVSGEKDGTEMQSIDHSKFVPLLVAAVQELIGKVEGLETEVAALKTA